MTLSNTQLVMLGTGLLGAVAGVIGSFAVLRRRALIGDLFAHTALPGLCLAFLIAGQRSASGMLVGALAAGLAGVALVTMIIRWTRTKEDAALGIVLSTFFGAGAALTSVIQRLPSESSKAGLQTYIYGQAAGMTRDDVWLIAIVAAATLSLVALVYKEFKLLSFDVEFAQSQGWPVVSLDLAMMGALALVTIAGLPAVGVVLIAAMIITPAAAARFWTDRLSVMLALAGGFGALAGVCGTLVSAGAVDRAVGIEFSTWGAGGRSLPTGPVIVLCGTALFVFSLFAAPRRGILGKVWRSASLRRQIGHDHLLRSLYELCEHALPDRAAVSLASLAADRSWTLAAVRRLVRRAAWSGLIESDGDALRLTPRGLDEAAMLTRRHRLWELYLIEGASIAPDHVDRDADITEHFLTDEMIAALESQLASSIGESCATNVPASPHELAGPASASPGKEAGS